MDFKYKIADVAKEFGVPAKKVIETVTGVTGEAYKTGGTFEEKELNVLLETLTRENAEASLDAYLASGKEEAKPAPKPEQKKPEQKKPEPKKADKPAAKAEQPKPEAKQEPKPEQKKDSRKPEKQAEKRNEKRVTLQELAADTGIKEPVKTEQVQVNRAQVSVDTRTVDVNVDKFNARYDDLADSRNMPSKRKNQPTGKKEKFNNRNNRRGQQFGRRVGIQIPLQSRRAVEIQKSLSLRKPQRQQAQPAGKIAPVERADLLQQRFLFRARTWKQASGLDSGQRWRSLPHDHLLRHQQAPCTAYLSRMPRSADKELV